MELDIERYTHHVNTLQTSYPDVTIVCVLKYFSLDQKQAIIKALPVNIFAESRIQVIQAWYSPDVWNLDFIGHLQRNKAKHAVRYCRLIHSVDSLPLAQKINEEAKLIWKKQDILLQINATQEAQKYWFLPNQIHQAITTISKLHYVNVIWCMCMGQQDNLQKTITAFNLTKKICSEFSLPICSMGMSQDRKLALNQGSTLLRLGRILCQEDEIV